MTVHFSKQLQLVNTHAAISASALLIAIRLKSLCLEILALLAARETCSLQIEYCCLFLCVGSNATVRYAWN